MSDITYPDKDLIDRIQARYGEDFGDFIHEAALLYLNPDIADVPHDDHFCELDNDPRSEFNMRHFIGCIISDYTPTTLTHIVTDIRTNENKDRI